MRLLFRFSIYIVTHRKIYQLTFLLNKQFNPTHMYGCDQAQAGHNNERIVSKIYYHCIMFSDCYWAFCYWQNTVYSICLFSASTPSTSPVKSGVSAPPPSYPSTHTSSDFIWLIIIIIIKPIFQFSIIFPLRIRYSENKIYECMKHFRMICKVFSKTKAKNKTKQMVILMSTCFIFR